MDTTRDTILKRNAIALARQHRETCEGEHCNISLMLLLELLNRAGIETTEAECKEFI